MPTTKETRRKRAQIHGILELAGAAEAVLKSTPSRHSAF